MFVCLYVKHCFKSIHYINKLYCVIAIYYLITQNLHLRLNWKKSTLFPLPTKRQHSFNIKHYMLMLTLLVSSPQTTTTSALSIKMSACFYYFFCCFVQELFPFFKADVLTMFYKYNEWVVALSKSKKCKRNKKMYLRNRLLSRLTVFLSWAEHQEVCCVHFIFVCLCTFCSCIKVLE